MLGMVQAPFSWPEYLKEGKSQAAPHSYFKQSPTPPENEFTIGKYPHNKIILVAKDKSVLENSLPHRI